MNKFWQWPWGYAQNILIIFCLMINGFIWQVLVEKGGVKMPPFLYLVVLITLLGIITTALFYLPLFRRGRAWVTSYPFIICTLSFLGGLALVSGFLPQGTSAQVPKSMSLLGLDDITSSMPFILLSFFLCLSLWYAVLKRVKKFSWRDLPFYLNHLGLLIIIIAHTLGSSDRQRVKMDLYQDKVEWMGRVDERGQELKEMPFALKLKKFTMEEYAPQLSFVDSKTMKILKTCGYINVKRLSDYRCEYQGHRVIIESFFPMAFDVQGKFVSVNHIGASPVLNIKVETPGLIGSYGPVTSGSQLFPPRFVTINSQLSIAVTPPKARFFSSDLQFYTPEGAVGEMQVSVNNPASLKGWKLYQFGYDDHMGRWSNLSIIEAIYDPWIIGVYTGIYLLLGGSLLMLLVALPKRQVQLIEEN